MLVLFLLLIKDRFSVKLDKDHVFDVIGKSDYVLVHFFADGCSHCAKFHPHWEDVARMYHPVPGILTATVNCDRWRSLCVMFDGTSTPGVQLFSPMQRRGQVFGGLLESLPVVKWVRNMTGLDPFTRPNSLAFMTPSEIAEAQTMKWLLIAVDNPRRHRFNHSELRACEGQRLVKPVALSVTHHPEESVRLCGESPRCLVLTNGERRILFDGPENADRDAILAFVDQHVDPDL